MFNPNEHMMKLKGKDYLQVAWRLVWFRDEHPDWCINTECVEQDKEHAIFKAYICDENGIQKSSGHGSESKHDFGDYLEKAETKAIGRALAMLGYGTQFAADELDEGQRIVDSPINRTPNQPDIQTEKQDVQIKVNDTLCECCGVPIEGIRAGDKLISASEVIAKSRTKYGKALCYNCCKTMLKEAS
jgi:ribosomal protein L34E